MTGKYQKHISQSNLQHKRMRHTNKHIQINKKHKHTQITKNTHKKV